MPQASTEPSPPSQTSLRVSGFRLFIRALGVSFFSVLSVLIALYAFTALPQVQDLLFDARSHWFQEVIYWSGFYAIGIFVWALPLVFTARLLLMQNFDLIGVDTEERFEFYIFKLPSYYVIIAFAAVLLGVFNAAANLPSPTGGNKYEAPLRNLLETHLTVLLIATTSVLILVLIRNLLLRGFGRRIERMEQADPEEFKKTLIRIERLTRKRASKLEELDLHLTGLKPDFLSADTWITAQRVKVFMWRYMSRLTLFLLILAAVHFLSYSETVQSLFAIPDLSSNQTLQHALTFIADTLYLKRASFLFIVFGALLPFITILALLSNRYQFPFITALIVVVAGLTLFISDGHDVRTAKISKENQAVLKPTTFTDAVKNWKEASGWNAKGCELLVASAPELAACPRPILAAAEGGGSRAAFLLASVLGSLEDDSLDKLKNPAARPFHRQLFAISSVSGSSVGAAFFVSALKVQPSLTVDKLRRALYKQRLWFPNVVTAKPVTAGAGKADAMPREFLTDFVTYKDALQAALSNDFISPAMIAYLSRDVLMLSRFPFVMDRAGVLETSWEEAFNSVYGTAAETSPLSGPLQAMAPSPGAWTPLLFLNTTSTETGRRVIATPVKITEPIGTDALFIDAYDMHELMCSPYRDPATGAYPSLSLLDQIARMLPSLFSPLAGATCVNKKPISIDIPLSTAAGTSSRSPFVSPHANIRDRRAQIADSVVDGGYFDNSGVVTAVEIARGLKLIDPRLRPFILQVSSEPDWFKDAKNCTADGTYLDRPQIPDQADFRPIGSLTDLLTVNSTRVSRGYETILELPEQARQLNGGVLSAAQIHVCPQPRESFFWSEFLKITDTFEEPEERALRIRERTHQHAQYKSVSLSWWLSPPLQAYLDGQIYAKHNADQRDCILSLLKDSQPSETPVCH